MEDVENYIRRLKIHYFTGHRPNIITTDTPFSRFHNNFQTQPKRPRLFQDDRLPTSLRTTCDDIRSRARKFLRSHLSHDFPDNLSCAERQCLNTVSRNDHVILKPADKGSSWILLDRTDYIKEADRQLAQPCYSLIDDNSVILENHNTLITLIKTLHKSIPSRTFNKILPDNIGRDRNLYLLPKIHKKSEDWPLSGIPPGRPIISDCSSDSEAVTALIDAFLQPLVLRTESYLQDTDHLIALLSTRNFPMDCLLASIDICSLYTSIDNEEGLAAIKAAFENFPDPLRPDADILALLKHIMSSNCFSFNGKQYLQTNGTAMGKKFSPSYANLFMASWERKLFQRADNKPLFYKRYIDDIFLIWPGDQHSFNSFLNLCNDISPSIKVTSEVSDTKIHFLDVFVLKSQRFFNTGLLDFKIAFKSTDSHRLLSRNSFHPPHVKRGVIWSQVLRLARRSNNKTDFDEACNTCFKVWRTQGYNHRFLRNTKYKVLMSLGFYKAKAWPRGFVHCNRRTCKLCDNFCWFTDSVHNQNHSLYYRIFSHVTCDSTHVVYTIKCVLCNRLVYVGETALALSLRMNNHLSTIRCHRDTPVATHFNSPGHNLTHIRFTAVQSFEHSNLDLVHLTTKRREAENLWIKKLETLQPIGLNLKVTRPFVRRIPFVTNYSPPAMSFIQTISQLVKGSFGFETLPSYRNNANLRKLLCPSRLRSQTVPSIPDE